MLRSLIAAAALTLSVTVSHAQCGPVGRIFEALDTQFKERPVWTGTVGDQRDIGVLTQSEKGTWTFVIVRGDQACLVASGQDGTEVKTGLPI